MNITTRIASALSGGLRRKIAAEVVRELRGQLDEVNAVIERLLPVDDALLVETLEERLLLELEQISNKKTSPSLPLPSSSIVPGGAGGVLAGGFVGRLSRSKKIDTPSSFPAVAFHSSPLPTSTDTLSKLNSVFLLIHTIMKHESPPPTSEPVISPLDDLRFKALYQLTAPDVQNVGRAFYSLVTSSSVSRLRAIEDYLHIFHSLRELSDSCPSFKRVLVEVSNVLFWKSSFQANFMLCIGAVLSIMDMVTDMTMVATFLARGNTGFAASMVAMISTNIFFQLVMTLDQTRDLGLKVFLLEAFYTISFLAPGIHAYRVASGKEIVKGEKLGPQNVLIFSKCMELVFEAVPGLLFQIYVYITLPISGNFAIVSIATSAMTTAFSASQMFFDKDTDLNNRLRSPNFYGIFPDEAGTDRSIAFLWLFIFSLAHVLAKGLGMALFWATFGGRTLFYYYGAEWGALLVVKALRKELVPWTPVTSFGRNLFFTLFLRLVTKILTDFTGFLQMRHPWEAGGLFYTLSLIWGQVSTVVCVVLYLLYYDEEDDGDENHKRKAKMSTPALVGIVSSLVILWLFAFRRFIRKINQRYLHTFFGTMTGPEFTITHFRTGDDYMRKEIFGVNVLHWNSIRLEVIAWTRYNWERWKVEMPEWFTDHWIASLPSDEFLPIVSPDAKDDNGSVSGGFLSILEGGEDEESASKASSDLKSSDKSNSDQKSSDSSNSAQKSSDKSNSLNSSDNTRNGTGNENLTSSAKIIRPVASLRRKMKKRKNNVDRLNQEVRESVRRSSLLEMRFNARLELREKLDKVNSIVGKLLPVKESLEAVLEAEKRYNERKNCLKKAKSMDSQETMAVVPIGTTFEEEPAGKNTATPYPRTTFSGTPSIASNILLRPLPCSTDTMRAMDLVFSLLNTILQHESYLVVSPMRVDGSDIRDAFLSEVSEADVKLMGQYFFASTVVNSTPSAAVDFYILQLFCLREFDESCPAFRPLMEHIAQVVLSQKSFFGTNTRLCIGAALSICDMITDVIMVAQYVSGGRTGFARALILMIGLNICFQCFVVVAQTRKSSRGMLLLDLFFTVIFVAPAIHAYRVASSNRGQLVSETVDNRTMLIFCNGIELMFETVPGLLLQIFAYVSIPSSSFALFSILSSGITTAFSVSSMFFDKDTDSHSRNSNPFFYGVFPDDVNSRTVTFFWLFLFSLAHVLNRALGMALFWATYGGLTFTAAYCAEVLAFFAVRVVRSDFFVWIPVEEGGRRKRDLTIRALVAIIYRISNKVLCDTTGYLQTRHNWDCGGLLWTVTLVWSQISSIVSVVLYQLHYEVGGKLGLRSKISAVELGAIATLLFFVWFVSFSSFIRHINQKYLRTFFDTMTGPEYAVFLFKNGDDRMRKDIFSVNALFWVSIRGDVKDWTYEGWARWNEKRPVWFTEIWISTVPDDFIPTLVQKDRRRSSFLLAVLGLPAFRVEDDQRSSKSRPLIKTTVVAPEG